MKVVEVAGKPEVAQVYVLQLREGLTSCVECVGAVDPNVPRREKVVLVISSQFGCPVQCAMCDAGRWFYGNLTAEEIRDQIRHLVTTWAQAEARDCPKFKVQFARMGEPALNDAVLEVLNDLNALVPTKGLMPCVATTAPRGREAWFDRMRTLRRRHYGPDRFQLQFSVQSTQESVRDRLIPIPKWSLREIGMFSSSFVEPGDRKVVLNFALALDIPVSASVLADTASPETCVVKLTPLNPTSTARAQHLVSAFSTAMDDRVLELAAQIESFGFQCIVSVGADEETRLGTSCGQVARLSPQPTLSSSL